MAAMRSRTARVSSCEEISRLVQEASGLSDRQVVEVWHDYSSSTARTRRYPSCSRGAFASTCSGVSDSRGSSVRHDAHQGQRVGRGLDAGGVDTVQHVEVLHDRGELLLELLDVSVRKTDTRQARDVQYFFAGKCHRVILDGSSRSA